MAMILSRRSALTVIAGGASLAAGRAHAEGMSGRPIYPVAVPIYQSQFVADRIGYFKEAGLDCKLIQGGSGVKTREIIASSQGDVGIGDVTHPMQLANHGRAGRILMPTDTRSSSVDVHHPQGSLGSGHHDAGEAHRVEASRWPQADRLGVLARRHQPRLVVLLYGNDGACRESDLDRHRQCRHHAGVAQEQAGRCARELALAAR